MVLPAPAAHDEVPPRDAGWIEQVRLSLQLSGARGILIHVDRAVPERLGDLVRGLIGEHPEIDVHTDLGAVETSSEGSVMVLILRPEHAEALNLGRPIFARRRLKVVLWCDRETTLALIERAPDFFDWVSEHHECPVAGAVAHAVAGLRRAYNAGAPGIVWRGPGDQADKGRLLAAFSAAVPDMALVWIDPRRDYEELLQAVEGAQHAWIAYRALAASHVRRLRWALAERSRTGAILVTAHHPCSGWWPVHGRLMGFAEARSTLEEAGVPQPGAVAALTGLEPEAVEMVREMSRKGSPPDVQNLRAAADPGEDLARLMPTPRGDRSLEELSPPVLRHWGWFLVARNLKGMPRHRPPMSSHTLNARTTDEIAEAVEGELRHRGAGAAWLSLAARALGDIDVANVWEGERPRSLPLPVEDRNGYEIFVSEEGRSELLQTALLAYDLKPQVDDVTQLIDEGAFAKAIRTLEVLDAAARAVEVEHPVIRSLIGVSVRALVEQGSFDAALQRVAKALALEGRLVGVDRTSFASLLPLVAQIFTQAGRAADAEALLSKLLGPDAPEPFPGESAEDPAPYALASISNSEADEHLQLFLALPKPPTLSDEHRAEALRLLAEAWIIQGRYDEADHLLERASVQADQVLPPAHRERWRTLTTYGRALYLQRRPDQAEPTLHRALTLAEKHAGKQHPDTGRILAELARVEHRLGRPEAPATAKHALAVLEAAQIADTEKELARADLSPIAEPG